MMPLVVILIVVLTTWGVGAAVGSASSYLVAAVSGVAITLVLVGVAGAIAAWRSPRDEERLAPLR